MQLGIIDYFVLGDSFTLGWITLDILANLFLVTRKGGAYLRFFGSRYTRRTNAVVASFLQFILALVVSFFINDFWSWIITQTQIFLLPISIVAGVVLYLYILASLRDAYKMTTPKRLGPAIACLAFACVLFYLIFMYYPR